MSFTTNNWIVLVTMLVYMAVMVIIGFAVSKLNKSSSDFFLGGRKLGPLVTAMSAEASDMSGWLLMGMPGLALMTGVPEAFWTATGLSIGTYLNWLFVAKLPENIQPPASIPTPFPTFSPAVSATGKRC